MYAVTGGARTLGDARSYLAKGPLASYEKFGFGLWLVEAKESGVAMGMCGLLQRDVVADVDLGYAFLAEFWSRGYALEAASAVLSDARVTFGLRRVAAVVSPDNRSSIRLLEKMGFEYEKMVRLAEDAPESKLFLSDI